MSSESRIQKSKRNIIATMLQNLLNVFIALTSRVVFAKFLSAQYLGINGLFVNVINILSIADLGMTTAMMYHLYKPLAEYDTERIKSLISFFKKVYVGIATIIFVLGIALIPFLKYIVNLPEDIPNIYLYYILILFNTVMSYLFIYRTTLLSADQKNYLLVKSISFFNVVIFAVRVVVLWIYRSYLLYLLVGVVFTLICNIVQNRIALKEYPYLKTKAEKLDLNSKSDIIKDVKALFMYKVSGTIQTNTDSILTSIFVGTIVVGYYSNYILITSQVITVISLVFNNLKASIGNALSESNRNSSNNYFLFNTLELINYWLVLFCSISIFIISKPFIGLFFGKEYILNDLTVLAIVLNFYTYNIRQTVWAFRETTGIFEQTKYVTGVTAIINIVLSFIMGYYWGINGILIATVSARMLYAWWKEPKVLLNEFFGMSCKKYLLTYLFRLSMAFVIGGICYGLCGLVETDNYFMNIISYVGICCIVPNLYFLIIYRKKEEYKYFFSKLLSKY